MANVNKVIVVGYLGADPRSRFTPTGVQVTQFSVGVTERWTGKDGQPAEHTEWINVEVWRKLAEICNQYLRKGSQVYIEGKLRTQKYTDDKNVERYFTKVVGQTMQMLDRKGAGTTEGNTAAAAATSEAAGMDEMPEMPPTDDGADISF
jgi:single stranded DNA-binding protein (ssb)